jgi:hypothetical protein
LSLISSPAMCGSRFGCRVLGQSEIHTPIALIGSGSIPPSFPEDLIAYRWAIGGSLRRGRRTEPTSDHESDAESVHRFEGVIWPTFMGVCGA